MQTKVAAFFGVALYWSAFASAEPLPPPIKQQIVDSRGVGIKNGRMDGLIVPLITIGGYGAAALERSYIPQDGREVLVKSIYNIRQSRVYASPSDQFNYFEHQTVTYPRGSITFRKIGDAYVEEHKTGATLTYQNNKFTFVDKYGIKNQGDKIIYPDGREVWGGTLSPDLVGPILHQVNEVRNNFGYRLRTSGEITQAINMTIDYCGFDYSSACQNLSVIRSSRVQQDRSRYDKLPPTSEIVLTNATNEVTRISLKLMDIFYREPSCFDIGSPPKRTCFGTKFPFYYPESVILPGSSSPDILITYIGSGERDSVSHNEVVVDTLKINGVSTKYEIGVWPYAGGGPPNYQPPGNQISVRAKTGGIHQLYAHSYNYGVVWPSSNLETRHIYDGLNRVTYFGYNARGDVSYVKYPEGNGISYTYDSRFNITAITHFPGPGANKEVLTTRYEYPGSCSETTQAVCNLPRSMTDPRGQQTDYLYNTRGQLEKEIGPAPSAGAPRPITSHSYTMRTAFVKDANGNPVPAGSPISLLTRTSICRTNTSCSGTPDEVITEYDYGPTSGLNNLNLLAVAITATNSAGVRETLRTCYKYNYFGDRISETKPNAALGSCPAS
jgi:hypothetical protein